MSNATSRLSTKARHSGAGRGTNRRRLPFLSLPQVTDLDAARAEIAASRAAARNFLVSEATGSAPGWGVIIVGANDWAAAWALNDARKPLYPAVPGGERQREMAYRFGINLMMYVLTGNYKADQVHLPAILERLGQ